MVQKAVNAKAKAGLKSSIMVWKIDYRYTRDYYLSQTTSTKMQTQGLTAKKSKHKDSKPRKSKVVNSRSSVLPCIDKSAKPICQEKKKKDWKKK